MNRPIESSVLASRSTRFGNHLVTLRGYAARVISEHETLTPWEDADRATRLQDFFEVGISNDCTYRELVKVLLPSLGVTTG